MSRCFPFPPPGYEKKARPDDMNLIIKEKHKQKKHKDKKDKDKKERSERKEKERSEKQKDDKDRKQKKHKDKKDKKKDKRRSSDEKKIVGSLENQNGEKCVPDSKPGDGIQDYRILVELGKRVRNDGGATDNQMVQKITLMEQSQSNFMGKMEENSDSMLSEVYDDIKDKREPSRIDNVQNLKADARGFENGLVGNFSGENQNKVEGGSCQVEKVEKKNEGKEKNKHRNSGGKGDERRNEDRDKNRKAEEKKRKKEKKKEKVKERSKEQIKQRGSDGNFLDFHEPSDLKESHDSQGSLPKHKEPELNSFLHGNGNRLNNLSRPAFSSHQVSPNGSGFHPSHNITNLAVEKGAVITNHKVNGNSSSKSAIKNSANVEPGQTANNFTAEHGRATTNNHVVSNGLISSHVVGIGRKIEPCETPNKVAKVEQGAVNNQMGNDKFPSSHSHMENGRKITGPNIDKAVDLQGPYAIHKKDDKELKMNDISEGKRFSTSRHLSASVKPKEGDGRFPSSHPLVENGRKITGLDVDKAVDLQRPDAIHKKDQKELSINGIIEGKRDTSSRLLSASVKAKEKFDTSLKPPHPDSKYLTQILTVPKVEWPQFDDQEWLFGCKDSLAKRPKLAPSQIERTKQVWAEAMQLEPADVTAMPYVIPY